MTNVHARRFRFPTRLTRAALLGSAFGLAVAVSGCGGGGGGLGIAGESGEQQELRESMQGFMDSLLAGDLLGATEYLDPSCPEDPDLELAAAFGADLIRTMFEGIEISIDDVQVDGDRGWVTAATVDGATETQRRALDLPDDGNVEADEDAQVWVRVDGTWYAPCDSLDGADDEATPASDEEATPASETPGLAVPDRSDEAGIGGIGDWYDWSDGLSAQVVDTSTFAISQYAAGGRPGDRGVLVTVKFRNDTGSVVDATLSDVTVAAGPDGVEAERVFDSESVSADGFSGSIPPGGVRTARFAFAVDPDHVDDLMIGVTPSWDHAAAFFATGARV